MDEPGHLRQFWPGYALALVATIAGGLVSAATAHAPTQSASWAAAYLVLVCGVATAALTVGRATLSAKSPTGPRRGLEFGLWVVGNALVLAGTLGAPPLLVDVGSAGLVVALGLLIRGVVGAHATGEGTGLRWVRRTFTTMVAVLLVSIPVGIVLSHLGR